MINFSTIKSLTIPEGIVTKIESNGLVLWHTANDEPIINQIPISINTDGNTYVSPEGTVGYRNAYRLNSSGVETAAGVDLVVTGFIPAKLNDVIYCQKLGFKMGTNDYMHSYFAVYDQNFAFLAAGHSTTLMSKVTETYTVDDKGHISSITIDTSVTNALANAAYIRMSFMKGAYYNSSSNPADWIITVNQPII